MARFQATFLLAVASLTALMLGVNGGVQAGSHDSMRSLLTTSPCVKCNISLSRGGCRCNSKCECVYDWRTYGFNTARTGYNPYETKINASSVARLKRAASATLSGFSINQVIVISQLDMGSGVVRDVAYVGDSQGKLWALDANSLTVLWTASLGTWTSVCKFLPNGKFGIGGTPSVDRAAGRLYAVGGLGQVFALNLTTGAVLKDWGLKIYNYTMEFSFGSPTLHPKLPLVYITTGSYCDIGRYQGRVIAVNTTTCKVVSSFVAPGKYTGAGIWGLGGVSIDPATGLVLTATGNTNAKPENVAYGEHVVGLNPEDLSVNVSFDAGVLVRDGDFGATPVPFYPTKTCKRPLVAVEHKAGILFILDARTLNKIQALQVSKVSTDGQFIMTPAWHPDRELLLVAAPSDSPVSLTKHGLVAFSVLSDCTLSVVWNTVLGKPVGEDQVFSAPTIAGNLAFMTSGTQGQMFAVDVASGKLLRTFNLTGTADLPPTVINGKLYVVSGAWYSKPVVEVYALPA